MRKYFLLIVVIFVFAWAENQTASSQTSKRYLGSEYKGNFVWGGAMNLCWNELTENILNEKVKLKTKDPVPLGLTEQFNQALFTKEDLDEESYYIKSGFGRKTVDVINKEVKEKFPDKSFADLDIPLGEKDLISYAYFLKAVEYVTQFTEGFIIFQGKRVKGFYADGDLQKDNIRILKYWDNDKFIIALRLKDKRDEIFLAKGFDMAKPEQVVDEINEYNQNDVYMAQNDTFLMPKLHLDHHRNYDEMIGQVLANSSFNGYIIGLMFENIKFDMDHKGARVENEALIGLAQGARPVEAKRFVLDKPFWVMMKRQERPNPYFLLGVNNPELMEKTE